MITTILLIRHGQTDWNTAGRWQGHTDVPLNENGIRQAWLLAERLAGWPIQEIYTSDLKRAAETAAILAESLGLIPIADPRLRERNGGVFQGLTAEELQARYMQEWQQMRETGTAPPGGESSQEVARRVRAAYDSYVARHQDEMVAVISHGGALNVLISNLLGMPLGKLAPISLRGNTGLSIVEIDGGGHRLILLNDVCHLSGHGFEAQAGFSALAQPENQ